MKKIHLLIFFILLFVTFILNPSVTLAQNIDWSQWDYLVGQWTGDNSGEPGVGTGFFIFQKDLNNEILTRKSHTEFAAKIQEPKAVHNDIMIIYPDKSETPDKAIYFDNEGHVINYSITYEGNSIILTSEPMNDLSKVRFTYTKIDDNNVKMKFEISVTGQPDAFKTYLEGSAHKEK
jgi:hypothetical protein